ncbi:MAG: shikimate kinase [Planctomycetota bacterium]|nr:shikimate kinase [Planctomycetota bacterium]
MNLVLIGLRATGKSTCGRLLAERLTWDFVDTDELVCERAGRTVREIFEEGGEELFRGLESEIVKQVARKQETVIATGGGAILDPENVADLRRQGFVVHLAASPRELARRIEADANTQALRPKLLGGAGYFEELQKLMLSRASKYSEARDAEVQVEGRTPEQIVDAILLLMRARRVMPLP